MSLNNSYCIVKSVQLKAFVHVVIGWQSWPASSPQRQEAPPRPSGRQMWLRWHRTCDDWHALVAAKRGENGITIYLVTVIANLGDTRLARRRRRRGDRWPPVRGAAPAAAARSPGARRERQDFKKKHIAAHSRSVCAMGAHYRSGCPFRSHLPVGPEDVAAGEGDAVGQAAAGRQLDDQPPAAAVDADALCERIMNRTS